MVIGFSFFIIYYLQTHSLVVRIEICIQIPHDSKQKNSIITYIDISVFLYRLPTIYPSIQLSTHSIVLLKKNTHSDTT